MPPPHAQLTEDEGVITVTFDRQDKRNAISPEMTALLWEAATALAERDDLRVLVITNRGPFFSAGIDIASLALDAPASRAYAQQALRANYARHHALYDTFESIEKPIVLAANGHCYGAGLEMAVSCDFRLASAATTFRLPEIALGVIAGSGGSSRLARLVGPHWAKWLAMANQQVDAEQARQMGLVHDVYPTEEFEERVRAFAHELIALPAEALGVAKLAVDLAADVDRTSQRHIDRLANTSLMQSDEFRQRTARFRSS
ncbi:MAG TPA: enoyl-CoA hydratase/isomerase family protein [Acidimicrobiales bacterium]|nr:enoyl-CoA hydratase/isomerase family protein [Acidimicrobiales bacterium]